MAGSIAGAVSVLGRKPVSYAPKFGRTARRGSYIPGQVKAPASVSGGGGTVGGPQMPYQPNNEQARDYINSLAQAGQGLLDPNSQYSQRMRGEMVQGIGQQTEAMQRAAQLNAARAGFGTGAGAELLETQGDIGRAGLEAQGQASADMTLAAPELGIRAMTPALSGQLGLSGQQLQGWMGQQDLQAQQQAQAFQAQLQQQQFEQQQRMMEQEQMLRELSLMGQFF